MLVLAEVESIFFIVGSMGLCFGIVVERALIVQGIFLSLLSSAYTEPFPLLIPLHQWVVWVHKKWEGAQPGQLPLPEQRDISYNMRSCLAVKLGARLRVSPLLSNYLDINQLLRSCSFASLVFLGLYFFHFLIFLFIVICYCCCWWWLFYCI